MKKKGKNAFKIILDVGANDGRDYIHYLKNFPKSKVYSFEPDPRAIKFFKLNLKKYNKSRWCLIEAAVGDINGTIMLNMAYKNGKDWSLSSSIIDISEECVSKLTFNKQVKVDIMTLDNWYQENLNNDAIIDFIHTDLQGSEQKFIKGAQKTLENTRLILLECNETKTYTEAMTKEETNNVMNELGYRCIFEQANDLLFENQKFI